MAVLKTEAQLETIKMQIQERQNSMEKQQARYEQEWAEFLRVKNIINASITLYDKEGTIRGYKISGVEHSIGTYEDYISQRNTARAKYTAAAGQVNLFEEEIEALQFVLAEQIELIKQQQIAFMTSAEREAYLAGEAALAEEKASLEEQTAAKITAETAAKSQEEKSKAAKGRQNAMVAGIIFVIIIVVVVMVIRFGRKRKTT